MGVSRFGGVCVGGGEVVFQMGGGFIGGAPHGGALVLMWVGVSKKIIGWGVCAPHALPPPLWETLPPPNRLFCYISLLDSLNMKHLFC